MGFPGLNMDAFMTINSKKIRENVLQYKGHTAQYCFDRRDYLFVGRLLNTSAIVSFHRRSMRALRVAFREALEACLDDLHAVSD
jgi:predicted HicB family RNase H-like nuclease